MAFLTFLKSIDLMLVIMMTPTYIRAHEAAADGINANSGKRKIDIRNKIAVVRAVNPVLPPADIPVLLSTNVDIVLVPIAEPIMLEALSTYNILPKLSGFPSLSIKLAFLQQPISVPIVSNISIKKKDIISIIDVAIDPLGNAKPPLNTDRKTELSLKILK